ncbi:PAS domain S-box protein [Belnapia sp. T6]|uniref:histidine kinase n=1 Tax=Belnapia mucosa TaxID=2804532 RepID=A0ABS1V2W6_9PROT|nr:PAS domain-containing sensor histidine kinase [Belnapia mucosa]MBL6454643.1 PAS domain S-box protein [Belnapia mucosa]
MSMAAAPMQDQDRIFRMLVEAVVDYAIYMVDPEGRVSTWNSGAQRIKGYAAEEVIGQPFSIFFTEEDREAGRPEAALATARRVGRYESEGWRIRKDGRRFWALAVLDAVHDETGRLIGFAKVTRDISERHATQQALLESERRFRLLVQGVTDYAIFMLDPEGRVTNWNTGARQIKGYEAVDIIGQHFSRFYTEEDKAAGVPQRALAQARTTGRFEAEGWRVRKDGSRFWASVVIDAIRDEQGQIIGFGKVTRDLTERREAQRVVEETRAQLVQSQKLEALGQLTGGVAHDFNNILQVISAGLTLAEKLPAGSARLGQILAEMRNAATRGTGLTKQLLAFSRRAPLHRETVDTGKGIVESVEMFGRMLGADIAIEMQIEPDIWPVRIDASQFEVALLNLAVNARDAMPHGGTLHVSGRNVTLKGEPQGLSGPFVAVSVRDTGLGIPEEVLSRIFEPFFTTKPVGKGTGLGLSQVHGFAQQAGGAVTIASTVNEGTEVTLLLPAASQSEIEREQDGVGQQDEPPPPLPKELRILVVDDDAAVARLTVGMLEGMGHRAIAVTEPNAALHRLAEEERFDMVLSDVVMPGSMNGVELARAIRRQWPDLPVLLATGYAGDINTIQQEFAVLHKPFTALELTHAIRAMDASLARASSAPLPQTRPPLWDMPSAAGSRLRHGSRDARA